MTCIDCRLSNAVAAFGRAVSNAAVTSESVGTGVGVGFAVAVCVAVDVGVSVVVVFDGLLLLQPASVPAIAVPHAVRMVRRFMII